VLGQNIYYLVHIVPTYDEDENLAHSSIYRR